MVMKLSTHSFTLTSPAEVAGKRSGCSEERKSEVCACEDMDGDIEKPADQTVLTDDPGRSRNTSAKARAIAPIVGIRLSDTPG